MSKDNTLEELKKQLEEDCQIRLVDTPDGAERVKTVSVDYEVGGFFRAIHRSLWSESCLIC